MSFLNSFLIPLSSSSLFDDIKSYEKQNKTNIIFLIDYTWDKLPFNDRFENNKYRYYIMSIDNHKLFLEKINWIQMYSKNKDLDIIYHTHGGSVMSSDIISNLLLNYPQNVRSHIPCICQSAGTLLALSSKEMYMNFYSLLGPVDPQLSYQSINTEYDKTSSRCLIKLKEKKSVNGIDDSILIKIIESELFHNDGIETIKSILNKRSPNMTKDNIEKVCEILCSGKYPHHKPLNRNKIEEMGIKVTGSISPQICNLFNELCVLKKDLKFI
uniref:Serine dehydrogenase proteinase n=1 Tax=viral metagenome TaxID=1070528 RepID=A0A6C0ACL5_9ZZZZ